MATRTEQFNLSEDTTFRGRVAIAIEAKAIAIASESSAGLNPARKCLAARVLKAPKDEAANFVNVVVTDADIASKTPLTNLTVDDAEIDAALSNAVWDGYAEAFA